MSQKLIDISLTEVSLVDKGANPGAHIVLMKREHDDAKSFNQALAHQEADMKIARMMDAFLTSVHTIHRDSEITNKAAAIRDSAAQFHAAVAELAKEQQLMSGQDDILKKQKELVDTIAKQADDLKARDDTITKLTTDLETSVKKTAYLEAVIKKADDSGDGFNKADDSGDGFNKADLPEAVQKKLDEQEAVNKTNAKRIQKMEDNSLKRDWVAKCGTEESADVMFQVAKSNPELADKVHAIVKAAEAQAKEAGLLKELGDGGSGDGNTAMEKVNKLADEIVKKDGVTHAVAVTKVMKHNPELYAEYRKEMN